MGTLERIESLSGDKTLLELRLSEAVVAINDLARMLEAVRYTSGLGKSQWERVEKARKIAKQADAALLAIRSKSPEAA